MLQVKSEHLPSFPLVAHWIHKTPVGAIWHGCDFFQPLPSLKLISSVECIGVVWGVGGGVTAITAAFYQNAPSETSDSLVASIRKQHCGFLLWSSTQLSEDKETHQPG